MTYCTTFPSKTCGSNGHVAVPPTSRRIAILAAVVMLGISGLARAWQLPEPPENSSPLPVPAPQLQGQQLQGQQLQGQQFQGQQFQGQQLQGQPGNSPILNRPTNSEGTYLAYPTPSPELQGGNILTDTSLIAWWNRAFVYEGAAGVPDGW